MTGTLDQLAPAQQDKILHWLELLPDAKVLEKIAAPPPDGLGIETEIHLTSLRRFHQKKRAARLMEELDTMRSRLVAEGAQPEQFSAAAARLLMEKAFESATNPRIKNGRFATVSKWLARTREQDRKERELQLAREKLELQRQKFEFLMRLREAQSPTEFQEKKIASARQHITRPKPPPSK